MKYTVLIVNKYINVYTLKNFDLQVLHCASIKLCLVITLWFILTLTHTHTHTHIWRLMILCMVLRVLYTKGYKLKKKSVAYSSQGNHTGQLDFCSWLADDIPRYSCWNCIIRRLEAIHWHRSHPLTQKPRKYLIQHLIFFFWNDNSGFMLITMLILTFLQFYILQMPAWVK